MGCFALGVTLGTPLKTRCHSLLNFKSAIHFPLSVLLPKPQMPSGKPGDICNRAVKLNMFPRTHKSNNVWQYRGKNGQFHQHPFESIVELHCHVVLPQKSLHPSPHDFLWTSTSAPLAPQRPRGIEEILRDIALHPSSAMNICAQLDDAPGRSYDPGKYHGDNGGFDG